MKKVAVTDDEALEYHKVSMGKVAIQVKTPMNDVRDLSMAYSPGVAAPCRVIHEKPETVYDYTSKGNIVGVVSDGTAVLGLGDIGPEAAIPVMEGKAALFKRFAGIDAFPICLKSKDTDTIIETVKLLEPVFGGINLEDISAPRCFEIETRLKAETNIPIFHDDQHGTAIILLAGLWNALKILGKKMGEISVSMNGAGASSIACAKFIMSAGVKNVIMADSRGIIHQGRGDLNPAKQAIAEVTNHDGVEGDIQAAMKGSDVFLGLSIGNVVSPEMVRGMADDAIVFAMANPTPEIMPELAIDAGARVVGTGRSDYPNQVNNVLGFPGIFRGALDVRATNINEEMKLAASEALRDLVTDDELTTNYVIPGPMDPRVVPNVALGVATAAVKSGVAQREVDPWRLFNAIRSGLPD